MLLCSTYLRYFPRRVDGVGGWLWSTCVLDSTYNKNRPFNRKTALNIYDESTPDTCIFCNALHSCQYVGGGGRNTKKHWILYHFMDKHPFSIANDWGRYCTIKVRNGDTAENTLNRLILLDQFIRLPAPEFIDYAINKLPQPSIVVVNEPTRALLSTNFKPICNYISQGLLGTILLIIHSH